MLPAPFQLRHTGFFPQWKALGKKVRADD